MAEKERELIKYPPFPAIPPGVTIIPFNEFKEHGIKIYGLPFGNDIEDDPGVEVDGLGIPTVSLRNPHKDDKCKTNARRTGETEAEIKKAAMEAKEKEKEERKKKMTEDEKRRKDKDMLKKMDPIARAQELRRRRILLFAKREWYDLWREGEDLRGTKTYNPNMSIIDRIHLASTEFRTGRTWPPASTRVGYLWDQFRLFVGLLGSPPIWYRTDLQQDPEDVLDDTEDYDDEPDPVNPEEDVPRPERAPTAVSDNEFEDDEYEDETSNRPPPPRDQPQSTNQDPPEQKRKRLPARAPYALHNCDPVPVSSEAQIKTLLRLASLRKHTKLLAFLADPELSVKIFLSWYARKEGLYWTFPHLNALPRLVGFFLELLIRTKAIPESERSLRKAVEVAKRGVEEIARTGRFCKNMPDKVATGCRNLWGVRWVEEPFKFTTGDLKDADSEEAALKQFEDELRAENVEVLSADKFVPPPPLKADSGDERDEDSIGTPELSKSDISIQVMSPTSPGFVEPDTPSHLEEAPMRAEKKPIVTSTPEIPPATEGPPTKETGADAQEDSSEPRVSKDDTYNKPYPWRWDTDPSSDPAQGEKALLDAWAPPRIQPFIHMFGMTVFPLQYEPGLAERSTRRVQAIVRPGDKLRDNESTKKLEEWMERRWRGVQEELVENLTRVVLEPWGGFDDGGCADDYRVPKVQVPGKGLNEDVTDASLNASASRGGDKHDPEKDLIVVLMEPRVAEQLVVGMGLSGTWVQIVRKRREGGGPDGGGRGGRGGYRGRGRGGWRGRGGPPSGTSQGVTVENAQDATSPKDEDASQEAITTPAIGNAASNSRGRGRGRGGPGRGRGGGHSYGGHDNNQKEFVFWYVEEIFMAVPSFWTVGEEDEPLSIPDDGGDDEGDDFSDDLED